MTKAAEALDHFIKRSQNAEKRYFRWLSTPGKDPVVKLVMSHESKVFENISTADVLNVAKKTEHALGDSSSKLANQVVPIRDWSPNHAFVHVFHYVTEVNGFIPTWQQFHEAARTDPEVCSMIWEPAKTAVFEAVEAGYSVEHAKNAMRYRVGNAYYSFLREAFVCSSLRDNGLKVNYHPLADALFRVDFYTNEININLYIGNAIYRKNAAGRKISSNQILSDAIPKFKNIDLELPTQHVFGRVHFPDKESIKAAANQVNQLMQK